VRRQLLAMLHAREFSDEAEWVDPCSPLVLPAVACVQCFAVAALDVTRSAPQPRAWCCGACGHPYKASTIESALMERLQVAAAAAVVCDLQCRRCKAMSIGGAQTSCGECGAELVFARDGGKLRLEARVIESVAEYHGLPLLQEAASWIVNG
jgi:DNA polymerase epsilon subunit 1